MNSAKELSNGLQRYFYPHKFSEIDKARTNTILDNLKGKKVLDAGSGRGNISLAAYERGFEVSAIDLSESSFKESSFIFKHSNASIDLIKASVTDIPFNDKSFNSVICSDVIEHVPDTMKAFAEYKRVLTDKGRLIFTIPNTFTFGIVYDRFIFKLIPANKQTPFVYKRHYKLTDAEIETFGWNNKEIFDHCQEFTLKNFKVLLEKAGFKVVKTKNLRFLDPYLRSFCTLLGLGPVKWLQRMDLFLAKYVPHIVAADWLIVAEKVKE